MTKCDIIVLDIMFGLLAAEVYAPQPSSPEEGSFKEPTDGTLRYRPWGAMPGNMYLDDDLKASQQYKDSEFQKLYDNPPIDVPPEFALMLAVDHEIGEARRKMLNYESYMKWAVKREPVTEELDEKLQHIDRGNAYIGEILDFALETSVDAVEAGKLTLAYWQRREHLAPFRAEAKEAIESRGGVMYPDIFPYHSISINPDVEYLDDGTHTMNGFIVRYKRDVGHIDLPHCAGRIHLVERQIAGYRVDEASGFKQSIVDRMLATPLSFEKSWQTEYMKYVVDTGARSFIEQKVQANSLEEFVVPVSATLYGYKELYTPEKRLARIAMQPTEDDGIAYFGPVHTIGKVPVQANRR